MKKLLTILLLIFALLAQASEQKELFKAANDAYIKEQYQIAATLYDSILAMGYSSANLYYNMGNAYYRLGEIGEAVLYFERAAKLSPADADVQHNLKLAQLNTIDKIEAVPQLFLARWWNQLVSSFSTNAWTWLTLLFAWLALAAAAVYLFNKAGAIRKLAVVCAVGFVMASLFFLIATASSKARLASDDGAVIMATSVDLKSAPDESGATQYLLHEGTRVEVIDEVNNWYKIKLPNGADGWLPAQSLELI